MLCTVNVLQERKAGLINQTVRQEGVALGKDRLAHQSRPLADDKQPHAVLPTLQRNLTDAADNPLGIAIEPRAEGFRDDGVSFLENDQDLAFQSSGTK